MHAFPQTKSIVWQEVLIGRDTSDTLSFLTNPFSEGASIVYYKRFIDFMELFYRTFL